MLVSTERPLIRAAIEHLNNNHGWGSVQAIRYFADGKIEVDIGNRWRTTRIYIARAIGRVSIRFRGHQMKFTAIKPLQRG